MDGGSNVALIVGAHNEEIEASICFLPQRLVQAGWRVVIFNPIAGWNWAEIRRMSDEEQRRLKAGAMESARVLGCEKILWDYPTEYALQPRPEFARRIAEVLRDVSPSLVFMQWPFDTHPDHRYLAQALHQLLRWTANFLPDPSFTPTWQEVWAYQAGISQTVDFAPDAFVLGDEVLMATGLHALKAMGYREEKVKAWWSEMEIKSRYWGTMVAGRPAEGLKYMGPMFPASGTRLKEILKESLVPAVYPRWNCPGYGAM
jgi:LmbE family N-acetylglucosaminyl deacetylase